MIVREALIRKLLSIYAHSTRTISTCEIATLYHEIRDDAVEGGAFVAKRDAAGCGALLACAECAEVLACFGEGGSEQAEDNASDG